MNWPNGEETTHEEVIQAWKDGLITSKECNDILGDDYTMDIEKREV